ncbi:MAG: hypothetical protein HY681_08750 [Chloroflexi bacterium]|nr:hypothetical protein [Chloroflexota bacterium]
MEQIATLEKLASEVEGMRDELRRLKAEVHSLREQAEDVVVIRTISKEDAKREIKQLFDSGETLYYSDIVHRLCIDLPLVVDICEELIQEGAIHVQSAGS